MIDMKNKEMSRVTSKDMSQVTSLFPGDKIVYDCAEGTLTGVVKKFYLSLNGLNELVPWVILEIDDGRSVTLCATPSNLTMMNLRHLFPEEVYG